MIPSCQVVDSLLRMEIRDSVQRAELLRKLARVYLALKECSVALDEEYRILNGIYQKTHPFLVPTPYLQSHMKTHCPGSLQHKKC